METDFTFTLLRWIIENVNNSAVLRVAIFADVGFYVALFLVYGAIFIFNYKTKVTFWIMLFFAFLLLIRSTHLLPIFNFSRSSVHIYFIITMIGTYANTACLLVIGYYALHNTYPVHKYWVWVSIIIVMFMALCLGVYDLGLLYKLLRQCYIIPMLPLIFEGFLVIVKLRKEKKISTLGILSISFAILFFIGVWLLLYNQNNNNTHFFFVLFGHASFSIGYSFWIGYVISIIINQRTEVFKKNEFLEIEKNEILKNQNEILEIELNSKMLEIQQLNLAKDKINSIIWHDLKTPLTSFYKMGETINYLLKNKQFDRIGEVSNRIEEMGNSMGILFDNLKQWSKIEHNQRKNTFQTFAIKPFLDNLLPIYRNIALQRNIILTESSFPSQSIYSDPYILSCIIRNLLDNALKNTEPYGEISLNIVYRQSDCILTITNPIKVVSSKMTKKIINLFEQKPYPVEKPNEMGLGLNTVLMFANEIDMRIDVKTIQESNFQFQLYIPVFIE